MTDAIPFPSICQQSLERNLRLISTAAISSRRESLAFAWSLCDTVVDRRDQSRIRHEVTEIVTARAMAVARAPKTGAPLATQSTLSRFENAPTKRGDVWGTVAFVDPFAVPVKPGAREIVDTTTLRRSTS